MKQNKPSNNSGSRLVYSSDGSHLKLCKKCGEDPCECKQSLNNIVVITPEKTTLKIKLEKNQRGGKLVTVIHELPFNPPYFEDLAKKLKIIVAQVELLKMNSKDKLSCKGINGRKWKRF